MTGPVPPTVSLGYTSAIDATAQSVFAFDGNASITGAGITFPATGGTATMWLNAAAAGANGVILGYAQQPATNPGRLWIKNPGNLLVGIGTTQTAVTNISFADGAWHHLAVTVQPQNTTTVAVGIYLDGVPVWFGLSALVNASGLAIAATGDLVLGKGVTGEPSLTAQMSQFVLWNSVLTDAAILSLMQTRPAASAQTLIDWALTSAQTSGQVQGGAFATSVPALRFRSGRTLTASWTPPTAPSTTFDVATVSNDNVYHALQSGQAASPVTIPLPQAGVTYTTRVRGVSAGVAGAWSVPASAIALDLGQPAPALPPAAAAPFTLMWPAVDQSAQYTMSFLKNGTTPVAPSGSQPGTSIDISTLVQDPANTYTYTVTATGGGSTGPASAVAAAPSVPVVLMTYGPPDTGGASALVATWPGTDNAPSRFLSVGRVSGTTTTPVAQAVLPGATLAYTVPGAVQDLQVYNATLRGLAAGGIGPWSAVAQVTIHNFATPAFGTIASDYNAHTIVVPWTFQNPPSVTALFDVQLWNADKTQIVARTNPATSPCTITNAAIVQGASLNLRMRAYLDGSFSAWAPWQAVAPNGVPKVIGLSARADVYGAITANWTSVLTQNPNLQGVTYLVTIYKPDRTVLYAAPAQSALTIALPKTTTNVQANTTYTLSVVAQATGLTPGAASDPVSITIGQVQPWPPAQPHTVNDPVDSSSGAFIYSNDDLVVNGVAPLTFTTCYNSSAPLPADSPIYSNLPLGNRWNHSYNSTLVADATAGFAYVLWGSGGGERYAIPQVAGTPYANAGARLGNTLVRAGDGSYTLVQQGVRTYRFSATGKLTAIIDQTGNQITLAYNGAAQLQTVTDPQSGHTLTFAYNGTWLQSVTDGVRTVRYTVTGSNLVSMTNVAGKVRQFTYAATGTSLIETVTDFLQRPVVKNIYQNGRVQFQQDARALGAGLTYGTQFVWSTGTYALAQTSVADITDRQGNSSHFESLAGNGALMLERYQLDATNILVRSHTYDVYANLLSTVEYRGTAAAYQPGVGNTTTYTWAANGLLQSAVTALAGGRISALSNSYDANGNLQTAAVYEGPSTGYQPGMGNVTTYTYNTDNTLASIQPPLGNATQFTYWTSTAHGLVKTMTDGLGNTFNMVWDANGMLQSITDPYGNVSATTWTPAGWVQSLSLQRATGPAIRTTQYTYNAFGQALTSSLFFPAAGQSFAQAFLTTAVYDDNLNRTSLTDPTNAAVTYAYDLNFNMTSVQWPAFQGLTRSIVWTYDRDDFPASTTWSAASPLVQESYVNDQLGRRTQLTDPRGAVYTYALAMTTGAGAPFPLVETDTWPAPSTGAAPAQVATTWDAIGRITSFVDRGGVATAIAYATQNDPGTGTQQAVVTVTLPPATSGGPSTTRVLTFDAAGRLLRQVDEAGKIWTWNYTLETDPVTQQKVSVATCTDPAARVSAVATDSRNRTAFRRMGTGQTVRLVQYAYDAAGRLTGVTQQQGSASAITVYAYGFDAATRSPTTSLGRQGGTGGTTLLTFNGRGDLVRQTDPFGAPSVFSYAPWGSLATFTDGRGNAFVYTFDTAGRLVSTTLPDTTRVAQTLDANGNRTLTQITGSPGIARTFDAWNRLLSRTDAAARAVAYQYWPADQLRQVTYPDGKNANSTLDGLGRLSQVTDWSNRSAVYAYSATGLITGITYKNTAGTVYAATTYGYDAAGCAASYSHLSGTLQLASGSWVLDALGQPATGQVVLPAAPTFPATALAQTFTAGNQLATINTVPQLFDNAGGYLGPQGSPPVVVYDAFGRVTSYGADQYGYDLDGLRVSTTLSGVASSNVFDVAQWQSPQVERGDPSRATTGAVPALSPYDVAAWDPWYADNADPVPQTMAADRLLASYTAGGQITARHVYGAGLLGSEDSSGVFAASLTDLSGNVVSRVTENGDVIDGAVYGPYGNRYGRLASTPYPFLYNGRDGVQDDGNGLLHMRAREYSSSQFRFLQPDPLLGDASAPNTLNRYAFAAGNPLQLNDPLGLATVVVVVAVVAIGIYGMLAWCLASSGGAAGGAGGAGAGGGNAGRGGGNGGRGNGGRGNGGRGNGNNGRPTQNPGNSSRGWRTVSRTATSELRTRVSMETEMVERQSLLRGSSSSSLGSDVESSTAPLNGLPNTGPSAINWNVLLK